MRLIFEVLSEERGSVICSQIGLGSEVETIFCISPCNSFLKSFQELYLIIYCDINSLVFAVLGIKNMKCKLIIKQ